MKPYTFTNGTHHLYWRDDDHKLAFKHALLDLEETEGPYTRPILYLLTSCETTREHLGDILDYEMPHSVIYDCWNEPWNTQESRLLIILAAMFNDEIFADSAALGSLAYPILYAMEWIDEVNETMWTAPDLASNTGEGMI